MTAVAVVDVERRVSPRCPSCGVKSPESGHPSSLEVSEGVEPRAWWCTTCLRAKVHAAHGVHCACEGCSVVAVVSSSAGALDGETSGISEFSAAGPAAAGTAPGPRVENGGLPEVDPTADALFCTECGWVHQERERPVLCLVCHRRWTGNFHAVCDSCKSRENR